TVLVVPELTGVQLSSGSAHSAIASPINNTAVARKLQRPKWKNDLILFIETLPCSTQKLLGISLEATGNSYRAFYSAHRSRQRPRSTLKECRKGFSFSSTRHRRQPVKLAGSSAISAFSHVGGRNCS